MTTVIPAAGWAGALLGLAASLVLAVLGFRVQRRPDAVRHRQLRTTVWCMLGGAALAMLALEVALPSSSPSQVGSRPGPRLSWTVASRPGSPGTR